MGEAVRAVVQPPAGTDPASLDASGPELVEFCRERLSHFKCPRSVVFVAELPRIPSGKLAKRLLPAEVLRPDRITRCRLRHLHLRGATHEPSGPREPKSAKRRVGKKWES